MASVIFTPIVVGQEASFPDKPSPQQGARIGSEDRKNRYLYSRFLHELYRAGENIPGVAVVSENERCLDDDPCTMQVAHVSDKLLASNPEFSRHAQVNLFKGLEADKELRTATFGR